MARRKDLLDLFVSSRRSQRMSQVIENIRGVRDKDAITDDNGRGRPEPGALSHVAPGADLNFAAVPKRHKLAEYVGMPADPDFVSLAASIPYPRARAKGRAFFESAGRPTDNALNEIVDVQASMYAHR